MGAFLPCERWNCGCVTMGDPLAAFPLHRRATVVKMLLQDQLRAQNGLGGPIEFGFYRSHSEIRTALVEKGQQACVWWKGSGWDAPIQPPSVRYPARRERFYRLVNALGDECSCCGVCAGRVVDHDHFTGAVRGLLCLVCNNRVDQCIHPCSSDCRYARYLNNPPAKELELKYPVRHRRRGPDDLRAQILGFDMLRQTEWPSLDPVLWEWKVPEQLGLPSAQLQLESYRQRGDAPSNEAGT